MTVRLLSILALCAFSLTFAAARSTADDDASPKVNYEDHVKPIFRQHCLSCHNQGEAKGGLALDSHGALMEGGGSGEIVYDGDAEGSRLWQLITHEDTPVMPPGQDKIPDEQIQVIVAWIEGGLLENAGSKASKKKTNSLEFVSTGSGKPEGPPPMPEVIPQDVPVVTPRAAAISSVAASPWAPLVAVAGQRQVVLYQSETAELLGILPFPEGVPMSLRFSRDGRYLIVAGGEHAALGIAVIYDVKTGERVAEVGDELDIAFDADINDDMTRVALGGPQKMLRIYSTEDGERVFDIKKHTDWIYAVAFSPDGVLVASGDRSAGLVVWEAETGQPFLDLGDHKGAINDIAWRDDSNVFASASDDGTIKLWDVVAGKALKSINAHSGGVTSVAFDHQGQLVSAGNDKKVKLWNAEGNAIREFPAMEESVLTAAITHDGSKVIAGDWAGTVLLSNAEDPKVNQPLAANPPPAKERLSGELEKLAQLEPEFTKSAATAGELQAKLQEVTKRREAVAAEIEKMLASVKQTEEQAKAAGSKAEQLEKEVGSLAAAGRDLHDRVIAARLDDLSSDDAQKAVAEKETELAANLQKVAQLRRDRIAARDESKAKSQEAEKLKGEVAAKQEQMKKAEADESQAKEAFDAFTPKHEQLVARKATIEKRIEQLREASSE